MAKIDLQKYGITGVKEVVYNPSYELLFEEETKPELTGYEKGQVSTFSASQRESIKRSSRVFAPTLRASAAR